MRGGGRTLVTFWPQALLMAIAAIAAGVAGAGMARQVGRTAVRRVVIVVGFAMALSTFLRLY